MEIDQIRKRRVRIRCAPNKPPVGNLAIVEDADTGEMAKYVYKVVITLEVGGENKAEITYYREDGPTVTVDNPEVDVTAYEVTNVLETSRTTERGADHASAS